MQMLRDHGIEIPFLYSELFFLARCFFIVTRKEGKKIKHEGISQSYPFWTYIERISTYTFGVWSLVLVHV